jgi:hypothetical protein
VPLLLHPSVCRVCKLCNSVVHSARQPLHRHCHRIAKGKHWCDEGGYLFGEGEWGWHDARKGRGPPGVLYRADGEVRVYVCVRGRGGGGGRCEERGRRGRGGRGETTVEHAQRCLEKTNIHRHHCNPPPPARAPHAPAKPRWLDRAPGGLRSAQEGAVSVTTQSLTLPHKSSPSHQTNRSPPHLVCASPNTRLPRTHAHRAPASLPTLAQTKPSCSSSPPNSSAACVTSRQTKGGELEGFLSSPQRPLE